MSANGSKGDIITLSAILQKTDIRRRDLHVRFVPIADNQNWPALLSAQQHRQLGDVARNPSRLIAREQVRSADRQAGFSY